MMPKPFEAPAEYHDLRDRLRSLLVRSSGESRPFLIGIDGRDGAGKSSLASWLAWQLEILTVHLDLYMHSVPGQPGEWRRDDLDHALAKRLDREKRPVIVEGILLLDALASVGRSPDFLVLVEKDGNEGSRCWAEQIGAYLLRQKPQDRADYPLSWSSAEYDRRWEEAILATRASTSG
jgi:hypothetical protein